MERIHAWIGLASVLVEALAVLIIFGLIMFGTVAITPAVLDISILGLLVLVRTFLGWTVTLELDDRRL